MMPDLQTMQIEVECEDDRTPAGSTREEHRIVTGTPLHLRGFS